jgi:HAD superfamily hydrolase (TIGR01490 family)
VRRDDFAACPKEEVLHLPVSAAAFFDVDGTVTRTTIVHPLLWYQRAHLSPPRFALWAAGLLLQVPQYLWIDRRSRRRLNVVFYRRYAGLDAADVRAWHRRTFADNLQPRLFPAAVDCLEDHQRQGHRVVLVTGGLDRVMQPLAEFLGAAELIATRLAERDGLFTGELACEPIADEEKRVLVRRYAETHGIDLAQSYAYGDSCGDLPMLECVGHPVAVNPGRRLRSLAAGQGWRVVDWKSS